MIRSGFVGRGLLFNVVNVVVVVAGVAIFAVVVIVVVVVIIIVVVVVVIIAEVVVIAIVVKRRRRKNVIIVRRNKIGENKRKMDLCRWRWSCADPSQQSLLYGQQQKVAPIVMENCKQFFIPNLL